MKFLLGFSSLSDLELPEACSLSKFTSGAGGVCLIGNGTSPEVQRREVAPFITTKAELGTGFGVWVTKCLIEQRGGYVHFRGRLKEQSGAIKSLADIGPASADARMAAA
jgi:hypothetical protein